MMIFTQIMRAQVRAKQKLAGGCFSLSFSCPRLARRSESRLLSVMLSMLFSGAFLKYVGCEMHTKKVSTKSERKTTYFKQVFSEINSRLLAKSLLVAKKLVV